MRPPGPFCIGFWAGVVLYSPLAPSWSLGRVYRAIIARECRETLDARCFYQEHGDCRDREERKNGEQNHNSELTFHFLFPFICV
jgi:hypothetical protein